MSTINRKPYPTDVTDQQWELLEDLIPNARPGGRHRTVDMREVVNAILYLARSGCQWDMLPHDLPPKSTVYDYFAAWRDNGTWQLIIDVLRGTIRQLEAPSKELHPSAASIDSQTVKTSEPRRSAAMTEARKSRGASGILRSTRWDCSWPWW